MYFEFLLRRAHSRSRVDRRYWSGESLYSRTTCSNSVMVGVIGPIGSGLPQLGFPRRFAIEKVPFHVWSYDNLTALTMRFASPCLRFSQYSSVVDENEVRSIHSRIIRLEVETQYLTVNFC